MTTLGGQSLMRHIENQDLTAVVNILGTGSLSLDERDEDGQTFLMVASQLGNLSIVQELLEKADCDVNAVDNDNWTALLNAAKEGYLDIVAELLNRGAHIEHRDVGGWTALMWACYKGRLEVAVELLDRGANPNVKAEHHMTCLAWTAGRGFADIVHALLDKGAKVNTTDKYGTTPLIWSARKGHLEIVEALLDAGATVDNAGMNSWTSLIIAAKGGFSEVVTAILNHNPNVNAVDKDGYTALTLAAKDGHSDIVYQLLQKGAYVNMPDRYGDTILIHTVKGGHTEVTKALLKKYADVDVQGVDNKTALYWAVEKGHVVIAKMLLEFNADSSICTKDGDTPLLKAVRSRNLELVEALLNKGAKVSQMDRKGDTPLHISVRGRSKRITEVLLRNPKDSRLLYKPNRGGETPYQIDTTHQKSILMQIFGARHLNAEESIQGYDIYSSTIADVLSEPALKTPITIGLYAKWGSGKSFLINKLQKEMKAFTALNADPMFEFSWLQFFLCLFLAVVIGVTLALTVIWYIGLAVGFGVFLLQYIFLGLVWFGTNHRDWDWADDVGTYLATHLQFSQLLLQVLFCNEPKPSREDTATVRFLFTDNARLASVVGEKSITGMIGTLFDAFEDEFGTVATRLFRVFKPAPAASHGRFKSICCVPYFVVVILVLLCLVAGFILLGIFGVHSITDSRYTTIDSILIAIAIVVGLAVIGNIYTWCKIAVSLVMSPRRRVTKIASHIESLKMEGLMQQLKKEVEWMGQMTRCMDAFLNTVTRLVVIVDGLDSCEQEKLLQVLDTVHMLFGDQDTPFITILAVDPHVVIKGIEHNLHGLFRDSSINGHDYLRNIVHLPFFLQSQTMPRSFQRKESGNNLNHLAEPSTSRKGLRTESLMSGGSVISLTDQKKRRNRGASHYGSSNLVRQPSTFDLSKTFVKNTYFSDINPRNMRRLMNIVAVTGRLLRAYNIDFSWYRLASWVNITEQWPYRLSWIILEVEDDEEMEDSTSLKSVYDRVMPKMPPSKDIDPLLEIDRNPRKLEIFLSNFNPVSNVGDLRKFLPCTINVDPYLRKLIRELQQNADNLQQEYSQFTMSPLYNSMDHSMVPPRPARRPQSRHEQLATSPRGTPTHPMSRFGYMGVGNQGLMPAMNPMMMSQYMMGGMMSPHHGPMPTVPPRSVGSKVQLQDGDLPEKLSSLSVDGISSLLQRLEGLSKAHIPQYVISLKENNINGMVLLHCELNELKKVLSMTFGDWELFRAMIEGLREREAGYEEERQGSFLKANRSFDDQVQRFTQEMQKFDKPVEAPRPYYPKPSPLASQHNIDMETMQSSSCESLHRTVSNGSQAGTSAPASKDTQFSDDVDNPGVQKPETRPILKKRDSFVGEVIFESQAIHNAMECMGVDSCESDEEEDIETGEEVRVDEENEDNVSIACSSSGRSEKFAAIPEEHEGDSEHPSLVSKEEFQASTGQLICMETGDLQPNAHTSSEQASDGKAIFYMSGESSLSSDSAGTNSAGSIKQGQIAKANPKKAPGQPDASTSGTFTSPSKMASTSISSLSLDSEEEMADLKSSEIAPEVSSCAGMSKVVEEAKMMSQGQLDTTCSTETSDYLEDDQEDAPLLSHTSRRDQGSAGKKKQNESVEKLSSKVTKDKEESRELEVSTILSTTPLMSPAASREQLNIKSKSSKLADIPGPSAFKVVTPSSSKASSRAVSRDSSVESIRVSLSRSSSTHDNMSKLDKRNQSGEYAWKSEDKPKDSSEDGQAKAVTQSSPPKPDKDELLVTVEGKTVKMSRPKEESFV